MGWFFWKSQNSPGKFDTSGNNLLSYRINTHNVTIFLMFFCLKSI